MSAYSSKSLKGQNIAWLTSLAAIDVVAVAAFVLPELFASSPITVLQGIRASTLTAAPILIMLMTSLVPADIKAIVVFGRVRHALPGHRAFSDHGPRDARVDMDRLQQNFGALPSDPLEQNRLWYRMYKKVDSDPSIVDAHKGFLLWRDAAVFSGILAIVVPIAILLAMQARAGVLLSFALFAVQFVLSAIASRHLGNRFVCNVMALNAATDGQSGSQTQRRRGRKTSSDEDR